MMPDCLLEIPFAPQVTLSLFVLAGVAWLTFVIVAVAGWLLKIAFAVLGVLLLLVAGGVVWLMIVKKGGRS